MKYKLVGLLSSMVIAFISLSFAQVATVEVQGVEATAAKSPGLTALLHDGSIGEVTVLVIATDANGNPVEGADVSWRLENRTTNPVYAVGSSAMMGSFLERASGQYEIAIMGGVTNAAGEAYLVIDSSMSGDARVYVMVEGVEGKTYDGRDMRAVWF